MVKPAEMLDFGVDLRRRSYEPSNGQPNLDFVIGPGVFCLLSIIDCIDSSAHSSTSVRSSSRFQLLALSAILHDNDRARFGARSAMVSVLPSGIDVRKLQRSHSEISRVEPLSDLPSRLFFGLPIRFSVSIQTLSDINLDRSKVKSDKLICVNTA